MVERVSEEAGGAQWESCVPYTWRKWAYVNNNEDIPKQKII